jgi:hypothetical protein
VLRIERLEAWAELAGVDLGEEERGPPAVGRERRAERALDTGDEAFAGQAAQIVAHLPRAVLFVGHGQQLRHEGAEPAVAEPLRREREQAQRLQQREHPRITELQAGSGPPVGRLARLGDVAEAGRG